MATLWSSQRVSADPPQTVWNQLTGSDRIQSSPEGALLQHGDDGAGPTASSSGFYGNVPAQLYDIIIEYIKIYHGSKKQPKTGI